MVVFAAAEPPTDLRCEWDSYPLSVDAKAPQLSWKSTVTSQTAYQIQVASSSDAIENDADALGNSKGLLWDSGQVKDSRSTCIAYEGQALSSRTQCYWRVRVWEKESDAPGAWSDVATWEMGLLHRDDWQAKWIVPAESQPVPDTPMLESWYERTGNVLDKEGLPKTDGIDRLRSAEPCTGSVARLR